MVTPQVPHFQGPSSVLPVLMKAARPTSYQYLQGHVCTCWKCQTVAGGYAGVQVWGFGRGCPAKGKALC